MTAYILSAGGKETCCRRPKADIHDWHFPRPAVLLSRGRQHSRQHAGTLTTGTLGPGEPAGRHPLGWGAWGSSIVLVGVTGWLGGDSLLMPHPH